MSSSQSSNRATGTGTPLIHGPSGDLKGKVNTRITPRSPFTNNRSVSHNSQMTSCLRISSAPCCALRPSNSPGPSDERQVWVRNGDDTIAVRRATGSYPGGGEVGEGAFELSALVKVGRSSEPAPELAIEDRGEAVLGELEMSEVGRVDAREPERETGGLLWSWAMLIGDVTSGDEGERRIMCGTG